MLLSLVLSSPSRLSPADVCDSGFPAEGLALGQAFPVPGPPVPGLFGGRGARGRVPEPLV